MVSEQGNEAFRDTVERHWAPDEAGALMARIDAALAEGGNAPSRLAPDDLVLVDEFHVRGREATEELAELTLEVAGFRIEVWRDVSQKAIAWFERGLATSATDQRD
jgi:hypothetical protein